MSSEDRSGRRYRLRETASGVARVVVGHAGSTWIAPVVVVLLLVWLVIGIVRGFAGHWFDVLHASAGAITLVMVFVIQHTTNRDFKAMLLKLDELIHADDDARGEVIDVENQPLHEQERLDEQLHETPTAERQRQR